MLHVERDLQIFVENLCKVLVNVAHHKENAKRMAFVVFLRNNNIHKLNGEDIVLHGGEAA